MKVIVLCSNLEPGGAQRAAFKLTNAFVEKGLNSACWFIHKKGDSFSKLPFKLFLNKKISSPFDLVRVCSALFNELRTEKPDVVISFLPYANLIGQLIALLAGVKKRISSHRSISKRELSPVQRIFDYLWAHLGIYTDITAVSDSTKSSFSYYSRSVFKKIQVVNNGVDFVPTTLRKEECQERMGIHSTAFLMGTIGRLVESKNHLLLVDILPKLTNVLLIIVGKGELKDQLQTRANELGVKDRLIIIDQLDPELIPQFLKALDVFVMPTFFEGMSNALVEALSAGLPIVSSDVQAQRDVLIRDEDNLEAGVLLSNSKPKDWVEAIEKIRDNKQFRELLCRNALNRSKDFTMDGMTQKFVAIF